MNRRSDNRWPVMAVAALAAALIAAIAAGCAGNAKSANTKPVSLLERPQAGSDHLSSAVIAPVSDQIPNPDAARFAGVFGGSKLYVVPGVRENLCLVVVNPDGQMRETTCDQQTRLQNSAIVITEVFPPDRMNAAGIAPDGFDTVNVGGKSGPIRNNAFQVTGASITSSLELVGPNGALRQVDLGPQTPPTSGQTQTQTTP